MGCVNREGAIGALLFAGLWIGSTRADSDLGRYPEQSPEAAVARQSLETAGWFAPESLGLLSPLILSLEVQSVERTPGSCTDLPAHASWRSVADYRTTVQARTIFALPLRTYKLTCGGNSIRVR